jgi:hypothetical protein
LMVIVKSFRFAHMVCSQSALILIRQSPHAFY